MPSFEIVSTPNPNSLKFSATDFTYIDAGMVSASTLVEAQGHPLAHVLLGIEGVVNVFIVPHFLTVTKARTMTWDDLVPSIQQAIRETLSDTD